jgi:hypothetical protein
VNRQARRAAASKASARTQIRVEDYRVGPGRVALTFDIAGRDPSTVSVDASSLSHVLARVEAAVAGRSYEQILHLLAGAIEAADAGDVDAWSAAALTGFWLAVHHPAAGGEMAARLSDAIAIRGSAHITMHVGRHRGIAFALADTFVDLDAVAASARKAGVATYVQAEPRLPRPGGRA